MQVRGAPGRTVPENRDNGTDTGQDNDDKDREDAKGIVARCLRLVKGRLQRDPAR
jgi:hypothetical protein